MARFRFVAHAAAAATLAVGLLTAVFTGTASACSCLPGDNEVWRYHRADHVFTGVVLSKWTDPRDPASGTDDQIVYTVLVGKEYKGDVPRRVDIATHIQGTACGLTWLTVGTKYLWFTTGDSTDRRVESHQCDGTRLASGGPPVTTFPTGTTGPTTSVTPTCSTATTTST